MTLKKLRGKLKWLDPFTYVDMLVITRIDKLEGLKKLPVFFACLAFIAASLLYLVPSNTSSIPIVAVVVAILALFYYNDQKEGLDWAIYLAFAMLFAFIIFTAVGIALGTQSPMMIVLSGSMEPLYHRGDIIILQGTTGEGLQGKEVELPFETLAGREVASFANLVYSQENALPRIQAIEFNTGQTITIDQEGSIVVYWSDYMNEPIVHRTVAKLKAGDGWYVLTKGDSSKNTTIDQDCGPIVNGRPSKSCIELYPVPIEKLQGKALFHIPLLGCAKLWLLDDLGSLITNGSLPQEFEQGNVC